MTVGLLDQKGRQCGKRSRQVFVIIILVIPPPLGAAALSHVSLTLSQVLALRVSPPAHQGATPEDVLLSGEGDIILRTQGPC
eukprot:2820223-Pyramimonas_sp.AAC.3